MATKTYHVTEELLTFQDSGGSAVLTLLNLAVSAGVYSARYDRGVGAKPGWARAWGKVQLETAGTVGEAVWVWVLPWSSHATPLAPGGLGTTAAALTADMRRNLNSSIPSFYVTTDKLTTATDIIGFAPLLWLPTRYVTVAVWNATTDNLENTANASQISVEFLVEESQ